jgi:hypothetical protein
MILVPVSPEKRLRKTIRKQTLQGFDGTQEYDALKAAGEKRRKRAARNQQQIMSGGWKQIPIIR